MRLFVGFRLVDTRCFFTFRLQNGSRLLTLAGEDSGAFVAFSLHLFFHGLQHGLWRSNVLQFNAVHLHAPLVGRIVEHGTQFGVDGIARGERFVQFQFADNVTQGGLREFFDSVRQVIDFIHSAFRFHDLEVEQSIDLSLHIVLRNHILLIKVIHLFAQVDRVGVEIPAVGISHSGFGSVDERDDDVHTRLQCGIIFAQAFNNFGFGLGNNHQTFFHKDEHEHNECNEYPSTDT